jgi:hypothetical protein
VVDELFSCCSLSEVKEGTVDVEYTDAGVNADVDLDAGFDVDVVTETESMSVVDDTAMFTDARAIASVRVYFSEPPGTADRVARLRATIFLSCA